MKIAVASRSFSKNPALKKELTERYPGAQISFNEGDRTLEGDDLVGFLSGFDRAITGLERVDGPMLQKLPSLKHVSKYGVGLDMIDLEAVERADITLGWSGGVNRRAVAELALTFMLTLIRGVHFSHQNLIEGSWNRARGSELTGKTIGIIGCGYIGRDLTELLTPFRVKILANDIRSAEASFCEFYSRTKVEAVELNTLLSEADIVTLHIPKNHRTEMLMNTSRIAKMKKGAILINTARGGLIDETALLTALDSGALSAAAMDVFHTEPPTDLKLARHPKFFGTPHIGGGSEEAMLAMGRAAIQNLENFQKPTFYKEFA